MLGKLRGWLRKYFTIQVYDEPEPCIHTTRTKPKNRRRQRAVPPSERFVWAMVVLIISLVGLVVVEVIYVLVTGQLSTEILVVISGLVGALASRFLEAKG